MDGGGWRCAKCFCIWIGNGSGQWEASAGHGELDLDIEHQGGLAAGGGRRLSCMIRTEASERGKGEEIKAFLRPCANEKTPYRIVCRKRDCFSIGTERLARDGDRSGTRIPPPPCSSKIGHWRERQNTRNQ